MKFFKLNEDSFRCVITSEELHQYHVTLEEIVEDQSKAQLLLLFILQEAEHQLGMQLSETSLAIRVEMQKNGDVALVIHSGEKNIRKQVEDMLSENGSADDSHDAAKEPGAGREESTHTSSSKKGKDSDDQNPFAPDSELAKRIRNLIARRIREATEDVKDAEEIDLSQTPPDAGDMAVERMARSMIHENEELSGLLLRPLWAEFDSVDQAASMAEQMEGCDDVPSTLYLMDHIYYLRMDFRDFREILAESLFPIAEYSTLMYADHAGMTSLTEHARCLLPEYALRTLHAMQRFR